MPVDFKILLWILKLGALVNVYFIVSLLGLEAFDLYAVVPALILLGVSAFRCLFPNRYLDNVVFHDSPLSSIFLTRLLATFSEVAYIYLFSYVIRVLNPEQNVWVNALSLAHGGAGCGLPRLGLERHSDEATRTLLLRGAWDGS